ncbi:EF0163 family protein [Lactococcus garvieae]
MSLSSLLLLSACGSDKVVQPEKIESSSSEVVQQSPKVEKPKISETKQPSGSKRSEFNSSKARDKAAEFLDSYYNFSSANERNAATKSFCNSSVQKALGLIKTDKDIKMESSIDSSEIYSDMDNEGEYLALVSYTLNGNKVTPQVLQITVEQEGDHYLVSKVAFPLMN